MAILTFQMVEVSVPWDNLYTDSHTYTHIHRHIDCDKNYTCPKTIFLGQVMTLRPFFQTVAKLICANVSQWKEDFSWSIRNVF